MVQKEKMCPICRARQIKGTRHKTCGKYECRGKLAEYTKKRVERQKAAESFLRDCIKAAKGDIQNKEICVVCGDFLKVSLTTHHFDRVRNPTDVVTLCGSCHRIFDSSNSGLSELKMRHKRYYHYNLKMHRDA